MKHFSWMTKMRRLLIAAPFLSIAFWSSVELAGIAIADDTTIRPSDAQVFEDKLLQIDQCKNLEGLLADRIVSCIEILIVVLEDRNAEIDELFAAVETANASSSSLSAVETAELFAELESQRAHIDEMQSELSAAKSELEALEAARPPIVVASRIFTGPDEFPPEEFAAYGMVVFPVRATEADKTRMKMICSAYIRTLRHSNFVTKRRGILRGGQVAIAWPISSKAKSDRINDAPIDDVCAAAVDSYGYSLADRAMSDAKISGNQLSSLGPYLLAWSPGVTKGHANAQVLVADLSSVENLKQAELIFSIYRDYIERHPEDWYPGWRFESLRFTARGWFDKNGSEFLEIAKVWFAK